MHRRRRVEHDDVVAAVALELVDALQRHVCVRAADRSRHRAIDRMVEDWARAVFARRKLLDDTVEGALRIEPERVEAAACHVRLRDLDGAGMLVDPLEPERMAQSRRRVDGEHRGAQALRSEREAQRRGAGRLADAAFADEHDQTPAPQQLADLAAHALTATAWNRRAQSASSVGSPANSNGSKTASPPGLATRRACSSWRS